MHPHSLWWCQNVVNTYLRYRTTQASVTAEKSFKSRSKFELDLQLCSEQKWWWWGGEGHGGIYLLPNIVLCSPLSPEQLWSLRFTYEWIIDGWLPRLLWTSVHARMLMLPLTQAYVKDCILSPKPRFYFFSKWSKGLQFLTHCFQSKFRSIDGHHDLFFNYKIKWK